MVRKQGDRLKQSETKSNIIKYILEKQGPVGEPEIRKYLEEEYEIKDQGRINRHLHELKNEDYIELITPTKTGLRNQWDITKIEHLKNIKRRIKEDNCFKKIKLDKYEKSINIIIQEFGYDTKSPQYINCFIRLYKSPSFFNSCLEIGVKLLISHALKMYRYGSGFEEETLIEKLLTECSKTYIESKLNFKIPENKFRAIIEDLSSKRKEILEEYAWRQCRPLPELRTKLEKEKFLKQFPGDDNTITRIIHNLYYNASFYEINQKIWVESFYENLKGYILELSQTNIEDVLKTEDEYKDMYLKFSELLSLMEEQRESFENTFFNLLFEHFLSQDILVGYDSSEELYFAKRTKKIIKDFKESLKEKNYKSIPRAVDRLIFDEHIIMSEFMAKYKIPSILIKISDNPDEVLRELLILHNYSRLLEYQESYSVE